MKTLYVAVRGDLSGGEGRRAAQIAHAVDSWVGLYGPHGGIIIVYVVGDEKTLLQHTPPERSVIWKEPDFDNQATAFASDQGRIEIPLLSSKSIKDIKRSRRVP